MAAGEKPASESSTETKSAESASQDHVDVEERNGTRTLTSIPSDLSQQETPNSSGSVLFQARIASNLAASQKTRINDSSEDLDFEALSNFEDSYSRDGITSDSDETVISDFDELEGVSEGELSFSEQSQPQSPLLLGSATTNVIQNKSPPSADAIPLEPMDTSCDDKDEGNCYGDEDCTMYSPMLVCRNMSSQAHSSTLCAQNALIAALPNSECEEQHIPGTHEQAKELKDQGDDNIMDNDTMSHLSDKEWTELSFKSPVFIQGGNGNDTSVGSLQCCSVGTAAMCVQWCTLRTVVGHGETHRFTNSPLLQNNSAFESLEDYEDTLSQCEDETVCVDALVTPADHNSMQWSDTTTCSSTVLMAVAPHQPVSTCTDSPLSTHNITDEDFFWEE